MITNRGWIGSETDASQRPMQDDKSAQSSGDTSTNTAETVIAAYNLAARRTEAGTDGPFAAAVRAYLGCYPNTHPDAAARIVAGIISHRS